MISLDQALAAYTKHLAPLPAETLALSAALHRVLAQDIVSSTDLPRFTQSAVDGYALRAADVADASATQPLHLPIAGEMPAGSYIELPQLLPMTCLRILTGGTVPTGADTVIPQELVERHGDGILLHRAFARDRNIRHRGEEIRSGALLAARGERLTPGLIAALAMAGIAEVAVHRRPRIALLVTGDEVVTLGQPLVAGEMPDSNGPLVNAWLQVRGYTPVATAHLRDDRAQVAQALHQALSQADVVLTCGGASVGDHDHILPAAESVGVQRVFWKVAQKPGKPLYFGTRGAGLLLAFPGNPGAVLIGLVLHLQRVLDLLEGVRAPAPRWLHGQLASGTQADRERERLLRVIARIDGSGKVRLDPLPHQDSHMLSNLRSANALARLPTRPDDYRADEIVSWLPLGSIESGQP